MQLSAGKYHSCAVLSSGSVACWGLNNEGALGIGTTSSASSIGHALLPSGVLFYAIMTSLCVCVDREIEWERMGRRGDSANWRMPLPSGCHHPDTLGVDGWMDEWPGEWTRIEGCM